MKFFCLAAKIDDAVGELAAAALQCAQFCGPKPPPGDFLLRIGMFADKPAEIAFHVGQGLEFMHNCRQISDFVRVGRRRQPVPRVQGEFPINAPYAIVRVLNGVADCMICLSFGHGLFLG
jgi:hypothetical protein